jgi:hypothetical protein
MVLSQTSTHTAQGIYLAKRLQPRGPTKGPGKSNFIGWVCSQQHFARTKILREKNGADKEGAVHSSNSCAAEMIGTMPKVMARCDTSSQPRVWALIEAFAPADRSVFAGLWLAATDSFFAFWPSAHWGFVCPSSLPSQQAIDRPLARSERFRLRGVLESRTYVLIFRTQTSNRGSIRHKVVPRPHGVNLAAIPLPRRHNSRELTG